MAVNAFHARVVQHECDHLDGMLYPDRIEDRWMYGFIVNAGVKVHHWPA